MKNLENTQKIIKEAVRLSTIKPASTEPSKPGALPLIPNALQAAFGLQINKTNEPITKFSLPIFLDNKMLTQYYALRQTGQIIELANVKICTTPPWRTLSQHDSTGPNRTND